MVINVYINFFKFVIMEDKRNNYDNNEIEFDDLENYRGDKVTFNHESDVARAIQRVQKSGSQEMKAGWHEFKKDPRTGDTIVSKYHPDSREEFIESVNSFISILICEIQDSPEFNETIKSLETKKIDRYTYWLKRKNDNYNKLNTRSKMSNPNDPLAIPPNSHYHREYMKDLVSITREIERTLHLLIARLQYFRSSETQDLSKLKRMDED